MGLIPNWPSVPSIEEELLKHLERIRALEALVFQVDAQFDIKVTADNTFFILGDGKFIFMIPEDLDAWFLQGVAGYVTTVGSTSTVVTFQNLTTAFTLLYIADPLTIDASEFTSYTSASPPVVNVTTDQNQVFAGDLISVNVDSAGAGAKGLGVVLDFAEDQIGS